MNSTVNASLNRAANHGEILEQVGVAVITIDVKGLIQNTNQATAGMFGYSFNQMLGHNVSMLMPKHHRKRHDDYLQRYLRTGEQRIIGSGRRVEGQRSDGSIFPIHLAVGSFENNGELYFTGIVHDLSVQEHNQDQALRFGRIIDNSINEIFVFRADDFRFTLANTGALANLGYSLDELKFMTPIDIKTQYTEESFKELVAPLLKGQTDRLMFQTIHQRKDGTQYDADIVLHLSDAVMPPEFVAIVQDCTERNNMFAAVQQAQKMDSIGQLTGGIAHDFNNLLTVITGNLELLEMSTSSADSLELIKEARSASELGADLTSRLLSFARRSALMPKRLNLNDVILDLSDLLRRSVGESILFHTIFEPDIWPVKLDQSQLESALMNLAINARDAMSGNGTLTIRTSNRALSISEAEELGLSSGNYAVLQVEDTGKGINDEDLKHVFEPFYTTKSKSKGHGLGLSMAYGFARQSGGLLVVESELGTGTSFTMLLPRDWSPESSSEFVPEIPNHSYGGVVILLVEDDESVRRLTVRRLHLMGHTVIEAADGVEGLEKYGAHPEIDLVFTDIVMPGSLDGWQLADAVHESRPDLPIIVSSGYSEQLAATAISDEYAIAVLHKPYTLEDLKMAIANTLGATR